jgi:class 3 adenylate cyclase/DNA-binding beta-propeller fold protein YncE
MTLPSGTVTFLVTDIEGSTTLVRQLRERYHDVLGAHQELVRSAVAEAGGTEIDTQGDSFFFVFPRAREAVLAAANAQRALAAHDWPEDGVVRVRMGIHTGEATAVDGRYTGVAVHRAARISAAGHGGQVLLSQTTRNLLEDEEELPLDLRDLGEQRLKNFDRPVHVYQLDIPGLQERFPPLTTMPKREPRLPRVRRHGRKWLAVAALAVMGAAAIAVTLVLLAGNGTTAQPRSVAVIDGKTGAIVDSIPLDSAPSSVTSGEGAMWLVSTGAKTLTKIDLETRLITGSAAVPGVPSDVAAGDGAVWVLHSRSLQPSLAADAFVSRFEPHSLALDRSIDAEGAFDGATYADPIAVGRGVWASTAGGPTAYARIVRIDPATNEPAGGLSVRKTMAGILVGHPAGGLAADETATWAVTGEGVIRIDPETEGTSVVPGPGASGPRSSTLAYLVAVGEGAVWVAGEAFKPCNDVDPTSCKHLGGIVWRIDPGGNAVDDQQRVGATPSAIAVGAGGVWVADRAAEAIWRLDPKSLDVVKKIELGTAPADLTVAHGLVWVGVGE